MSKIDNKRRQLCLAGGAAALGSLLLPNFVIASPFKSQASRSLSMCNLHTHEELETVYFNGKYYLKSELSKLNHLCRDFRRNESARMDRRLFDGLVNIQQALGHKGQVNIISGYRSPATNKMLQKKGGVATKSFHMKGQAIDFNLEGVSLSRVRTAALDLKLGGVGYYPRSNFIHIDTGPVRRW